jgi:ABC-type nickel/cobalt efflux system permease component RcnA
MSAGAVVGAVMATLAMLVALGVINLEPSQMGAIETALVALVGLVVPLLGAWLARSKVTPVANPHNDAGERLVPEA